MLMITVNLYCYNTHLPTLLFYESCFGFCISQGSSEKQNEQDVCVCVCVCVYIYIYIYIHIYIHTYIHTYILTSPNIYMLNQQAGDSKAGRLDIQKESMFQSES